MVIRSHRRRLISSCVACWHAFDYDAANTRYRNLGRSRGAALYMAESATPSQRPVRLLGRDYVYLAASASDNITMPDTTETQLSGAGDVRIDFAPDSWSGTQTLVTKGWASPTRSWSLDLQGGTLRFRLSADGSTYGLSKNSSTGAGVADGVRTTIRVTWQQNGANVDIRFYKGASIGASSWTQIGTTQSGAFTLPAFDTSATLGCCYSDPMTGKIYAFQVRSGVDGEIVAQFDASLSGQTGYTDTTASVPTVWTINRAGASEKKSTLKTSECSALLLGGNTAYLQCTDDALLDFGTAAAGTVFWLGRFHGTPGTTGILTKRGSAANAVGWDSQFNGDRVPRAVLADGTNQAIAIGGVAFADHALSLSAHTWSSSVITPWTDGTAGSTTSRASVTNVDTSNDLFLFKYTGGGSASMEIVAAGVATRNLTSAEQKRLKWELQSYGPRFFFLN